MRFDFELAFVCTIRNDKMDGYQVTRYKSRVIGDQFDVIT